MVVIILQQISVSSQHVVHLRFTHVTCQFYPNKAEGGKQPKKKKKKKQLVLFFEKKERKYLTVWLLPVTWWPSHLSEDVC